MTMCTCGHADINHSDINLDALGSCYQCSCREYVKAKCVCWRQDQPQRDCPRHKGQTDGRY